MHVLKAWVNILKILSVILMIVVPLLFVLRYWLTKNTQEFFWGVIISFVAGLFVWHTTFYLKK